MNKEKFLKELEHLLMDLSEEEREEALSYYQDYFDEAGPEHEVGLLRKLGSPEKVAAELKCALAGDTEGGEFSERGYRDDRFIENEKMPDHYTEIVVGEVVDDDAGKKQYHSDASSARGKKQYDWHKYHTWEEFRDAFAEKHARGYEENRDNSYGRDMGEYDRSVTRRSERRNKLLLLILFLVFGVPLAGSLISAGFSVVFGLAGALFGVFGGLIGLIVGGIATTFALFVGGIGLIIAGLCNLATPALGIMVIGFGFLMMAVSLLLAVAVKWGCCIAVPGLIRFCMDVVKKCGRFIKNLIRKLLGKGGESD